MKTVDASAPSPLELRSSIDHLNSTRTRSCTTQPIRILRQVGENRSIQGAIRATRASVDSRPFKKSATDTGDICPSDATTKDLNETVYAAVIWIVGSSV